MAASTSLWPLFLQQSSCCELRSFGLAFSLSQGALSSGIPLRALSPSRWDVSLLCLRRRKPTARGPSSSPLYRTLTKEFRTRTGRNSHLAQSDQRAHLAHHLGESSSTPILFDRRSQATHTRLSNRTRRSGIGRSMRYLRTTTTRATLAASHRPQRSKDDLSRKHVDAGASLLRWNHPGTR